MCVCVCMFVSACVTWLLTPATKRHKSAYNKICPLEGGEKIFRPQTYLVNKAGLSK